jgi:hypothetical protein
LVLAAVDAELRDGRRWPIGFRRFDDYELYAASLTEANGLVARLQHALSAYELSLNESKLRVLRLPIDLEPPWQTDLRQIVLRRGDRGQRTGLLMLFDIALRNTVAYPNASVVAYALGRFIDRRFREGQRVNPANWQVFQRLMLQAALAEPGILPKVAHIFHWEAERGRPIERDLVARSLTVLVQDAMERGYSSEVAWGIWMATSLSIPLPPSAARAVSSSRDDVVALCALHARQAGVLDRGLATDLWEEWVQADQLAGEHWLVAYEAFEHGWLRSATGADHVGADPFWASMRAAGVRFYDTAARMPSVPAVPHGPIVPPVPEPDEAADGPEDDEDWIDSFDEDAAFGY